jgi:hypothetical protein
MKVSEKWTPKTNFGTKHIETRSLIPTDLFFFDKRVVGKNSKWLPRRKLFLSTHNQPWVVVFGVQLTDCFIEL